MTIASEITRIKNNIKDAYTALEVKGATIPEVQNSTNLVTMIESMPEGSSNSNVSGITVDMLFGIDENGNLTKKSNTTTFTCNTVMLMESGILRYICYKNANLTTVSFPNLTTIGDSYAFNYAFGSCLNLTTVSFPNLTTIGGSNAFESAFGSCLNLTTVSFPNLTTISGSYAFRRAFEFCTNLTTVSFPNLTTISNNNAFNYAFGSCLNLTTVSFPNLTTISKSTFESAFSSNANLTTLDLPSLSGALYGFPFANNKNLKKVWIPKEVEIMKSASNLTSTTSSYSSAPFYNCSSSLVIYTDAPQQPEGWDEYWNYYSSSGQLTVVYGATHEDFLNA